MGYFELNVPKSLFLKFQALNLNSVNKYLNYSHTSMFSGLGLWQLNDSYNGIWLNFEDGWLLKYAAKH